MDEALYMILGLTADAKPVISMIQRLTDDQAIGAANLMLQEQREAERVHVFIHNKTSDDHGGWVEIHCAKLPWVE